MIFFDPRLAPAIVAHAAAVQALAAADNRRAAAEERIATVLEQAPSTDPAALTQLADQLDAETARIAEAARAASGTTENP